MAENVLQTLQQLVQDVIAPDVRELKVRVSSLEKQMDVRFDAVDQRFKGVDGRFASVDHRFDLLEEKLDIQFKAIMAAISEIQSTGGTDQYARDRVAERAGSRLEARSH